MKSIIAATDFSSTSTNAVYYAAEMAKLINAELVLVNVYNIPVNYTDGIVMPVPLEELKTSSEKALDDLRKDILNKSGSTITVSARTRMGYVAEELEGLCSSIHPYAVVIGTRGKSNLEKTVFGSSALSIIKHLTSPVLCIPPGRKFDGGIKKAGFACDFKEVDETVPAELIRQFIKSFKAALHILHVDYKDKHYNSGTPAESLAIYHMFEDLKPQYHFIDNPDIEDGINEFSRNNQLDLLITIPKKHNIVEKIFRKSSTKQLINELPVPVMCIHG